MNPPSERKGTDDIATVRDLAATWIVRRDRGFSALEQAEFEAWLAADRRHAEVFTQSSASWERFGELGRRVREAPLAPKRAEIIRWPFVAAAGIAAAVAIAFYSFAPIPSTRPVVTEGAPVAREPVESVTRQLADGSTVRLRAGATLAESFTGAERRVVLQQGEAYFDVVKEPRPFVVQVDSIRVRVVGTAFAVRRAEDKIDVRVTAGTVRVTSTAASTPGEGTAEASELVSAGHRAVVTLAPRKETAPIVVIPLSPEEIASVLAWGQPMLELGEATLAEWATAFTVRSGRTLEIADPALATVRIGGSYPANDVEGFVRAVEEVYGLTSERRADGTLVLRLRPAGHQPVTSPR